VSVVPTVLALKPDGTEVLVFVTSDSRRCAKASAKLVSYEELVKL